MNSTNIAKISKHFNSHGVKIKSIHLRRRYARVLDKTADRYQKMSQSTPHNTVVFLQGNLLTMTTKDPLIR